jgi:PAS domain S-box-containing protein
MHPLLQRQLAKHLGPSGEDGGPELTPEALRAFVRAVDAAYVQADSDRAMLERSLELTSEELMEHNRELAASLGTETERAREGETRLRLVMDTLAEGIIIYDREAHIMDLNEEAAALFKTSRDGARGHRATVTDLGITYLDESGNTAVFRTLPTVLAFSERRPVRNTVLGIRRHDGTTAYVRVNAAPMFIDGGPEPRYVLASYTDVTAARLVERMKSDILTSASQELRTPLTGILGFASLLERRTDIPEEAVEWASVIAAEATRLSRISNDLLDAARLGNDVTSSHVAPVRLAVAARSAIEALSAHSRDRSFSLDGDDQLELTIDRERLNALLQALVEQAIRVSPQSDEVATSWRSDGKTVRIAVRDSAPVVSRATDLDVSRIRRLAVELGGTVTPSTAADGAIEVVLPLVAPTAGAVLG